MTDLWVCYDLPHSYTHSPFYAATSIIICIAYTVVSLSMITLGIIYRTECPAQWYIPIYSILTGVIQMCLLAWIIAVNVDETTTRTQLNYYVKVHLVQRFIFGIMLIWCGLGLYFVCSIAWPSSDASHIHSYCHPALYLFTLIVITVKCLLLCTCCLCCLTTGCCLMYGKCQDPTLPPSD